MLEWHGPDEIGVLRAYDEFAMYVISCDEAGRYRVGFFPAPGPVCRWGDPVSTLEAAKAAAEACVLRVRQVREPNADRAER